MKRKHPKPASTIKLNTYAIIDRAIEEGTRLGYQRAFKHTDNPTLDTICDSINREIMNALCEVIEFDE